MNSSDSFLRGRSNERVSVRVRFFCTKLLCRCRDGRLSKKRGKKRILKPPETYFYKITAALWSSSPTNSDSVSQFFFCFFLMSSSFIAVKSDLNSDDLHFGCNICYLL